VCVCVCVWLCVGVAVWFMSMWIHMKPES